MLNFPVAAGTSGHFLGALLVAILLGPLNGFLVMAVVLVIQALLFADGGLTALGTNIFNMGVIGGLGGYGLFRLFCLALPRRRGAFVAASAVAAWLSVVLAASVCAVELALSGTSPLAVALPAMAGVHALIGVGEAIISAVVISLMLGVRPDLVTSWKPGEAQA
jgi:cobalt/nickel transport system permease protein